MKRHSPNICHYFLDLNPSTVSTETDSVVKSIPSCNCPGKEANTGGGVFILVRDGILVSEQKHFKTDCEIVWVRIDVAGFKRLFIASYYRPRESDEHNLAELRKSPAMVCQENGTIWVLRDMNFPKLSWDDDDVPIIKPGCSCLRLYEDFIEMLNDLYLSQVVREATKGDNILGLFLTTNSTLVNSVYIYPGLSDHDIVKSDVSIKHKVAKQKPRKFYLNRRADWE